MKTWFAFAVCAITMLPAGAAFADNAPAPDPALTKLEQAVQNLGYPVTVLPSGTSFKFQYPSNAYTFSVHLQVSKNKSFAYMYTDIDTYKKEELPKLNLLALLEANNNGNFYFSTNNNTDGTGEELYANAIIPLNGLTPEILRATLDTFGYGLNNSSQIWDKSAWK